MSVRNPNTLASTIYDKLHLEINKKEIIEKWFIRIITLEFLNAKQIKPFILNNYKKEEIISLCKLQNELMYGIFNDDLKELIDNYPNDFYDSKIIEKLKEEINQNTNIELLGQIQEDYRDYERFITFTSTNRNIDVEVNEENIFATTQIFTPKMVSEYMVKNTVLSNNLSKEYKILDPCLGTGNILLVVVEELISKKYQRIEKNTISNIYKHLYGFDIDEMAVELAKFIFVLKALQYNPEFLSKEYYTLPNFYLIKSSDDLEYTTNVKINDMLEAFKGVGLKGSLIKTDNLDYDYLEQKINTNDKYYYFLKIAQLLNLKYDIILTNPPYMGRKMLPDELREYLNDEYKLGKSELYAAFIERLLKMIKTGGYLAMITLHTWMFIKSFASLRKYILNKYQINSFIHLGKNTFENLNAYNALACSFVIQNVLPTKPTLFIKLTEYDDIRQKTIELDNKDNYYYINQKEFLNVTDSPLIYWIDKTAYELLLKAPKLSKVSEIRQGLATGNNAMFLKKWYEVPKEEIGFNYNNINEFINSGKLYAPYNKGGDQTKWYASSKDIIKFDKVSYDILNGQGNHLPSKSFYFKEGITWSLFGFNSFNVRYKEQGYVFDVSGSSLFIEKDKINYVLGFLSSDVAFYYLSILAPTVNFQIGNVASLPFVFDESRKDEIDTKVKKLIQLAYYIDETKETSWNFSKHPLFQKKYPSLNNAINDYINNLANINEEIMNLEEEVNLIFNQIYGFNPPRKLKTIAKKSASEIVEEVISFVVGVVFNRYNVDNYELVINNKEYVDIEIIESEIRKILTIYFDDSATEEIEKYLGKDLNSYLTNGFWKYHLNDYNNLPIYWYKVIDDKLKIGYYHTLKDVINKEKGIKANYLSNHLYYKLK